MTREEVSDISLPSSHDSVFQPFTNSSFTLESYKEEESHWTSEIISGREVRKGIFGSSCYLSLLLITLLNLTRSHLSQI